MKYYFLCQLLHTTKCDVSENNWFSPLEPIAFGYLTKNLTKVMWDMRDIETVNSDNMNLDNGNYRVWSNFVDFYDSKRKNPIASSVEELLSQYGGFYNFRGIGFEKEEDYVNFILRFG